MRWKMAPKFAAEAAYDCKLRNKVCRPIFKGWSLCVRRGYVTFIAKVWTHPWGSHFALSKDSSVTTIIVVPEYPW